MTAEPRATIGRYEILREIARGGMGVVYEARDPVLERTVALKVVQPATESGRPFEERFLAEARIAAGLQHPGIVVVHDVGRDPATGALFIALELVRGETLAELAAAGPVDWGAVLHIVAQVARALHHAHLHGIVHRDIKPANVVVLPSGEAKVMDFGIARLENARQRLTTTGEFIGTPLYTAPEQAKTEEVDGRADVFSLASVAYTLLTGRAAFSAPTIPGIVHRVVYEEPDPASSFVAGLPADLERVLARALEKDPTRRYPTAAALAEDAEDLLAGRPPRHAAGDDLVVVKDADSPLTALLAEGAGDPQASARSDPAPAGATDTRDIRTGARGPRTRVRIAWAAAALAALAALLFWLPRPTLSPAPARSRSPRPASAAPQAAAPVARPGAQVAAAAEASGLSIDFDHPLRRGTLRVYVDDELALEQRLSGQQKTRALVFKLHSGTFRDELQVAPGRREVRLVVRWDDNVREERIVGDFRPGVTRRLEASLGRIRRDLKLEWK
jgi:serine/threonine-protein kinase